MVVKKLAKPKRLARHWAIIGYENSGKSTFAAQLRPPMLVVDADGRFQEQYEILSGAAYLINSIDVEEIVLGINENTQRLKEINTIIVDSLTSIMVPLTSGAMYDNMVGRQVFTSNKSRNRSAAFLEKALVMRLLQGSIRGVDTLWVWHLEDSQFGNQSTVHETLPATEVKRLRRSLNAILKAEVNGQGHYSIKVEWCRYDAGGKGPAARGTILRDERGHWDGMPAQLDALFWQSKYGTLSEARPSSEPALDVPHSPGALLDLVNQRHDKTYRSVKELFAAYREQTGQKVWPNVGDQESWNQAYQILIKPG